MENQTRLLRLYTFLQGFGGFALPRWEIFRQAATNLLESNSRLSYLQGKFEIEIIAEGAGDDMQLYARANNALGEDVGRSVENILCDTLARGTTNHFPNERLYLVMVYCSGALRDHCEPEFAGALRGVDEGIPAIITLPHNGLAGSLGLQTKLRVDTDPRSGYLVTCTQLDHAMQLNAIMNLPVAA